MTLPYRRETPAPDQLTMELLRQASGKMPPGAMNVYTDGKTGTTVVVIGPENLTADVTKMLRRHFRRLHMPDAGR